MTKPTNYFSRHPRIVGLTFAAPMTVLALWLVSAWAWGNEEPIAAISGAPQALGFALTLAVAAWSSSSLRTIRQEAVCSACSAFGRLFHSHDGLDATLSAFAGMLRERERAESCVVVLDDAHSKPARLYVANGSEASATHDAALDPQLARALLALPPERAMLYEPARLPFAAPGCLALDVSTLETAPADRAQLSALANLLEAESFVSLPLRSRGRTLGRVHLVSRRRCPRHELHSLTQLVAQAGPLIEHIQLVEHLRITVANQERRRISRDLHDSTVQPYVGLKLGLEALRRKLPSGAPAVQDIDELIAMAGDGISQLRQYVGRLKDDPQRLQKRVPLVHSVRFQVQRFSELYPIQATVLAPGEIPVSSALCEELIQIVREALSNVRRHTRARRASVELHSAGGTLFLQIANDHGDTTQEVPHFHPGSISERAHELGGHVKVSRRPNGDTVVAVEVPL